MLQSPVSETKETTAAGKQKCARMSATDLHPHVAGAVTSGYSTSAAGRGFSNRENRQLPAIAKAQSAYGNQAVLQMLTASRNPALVLQRKCGCDGSGGDCAKCNEQEETALQRRAGNGTEPNSVPPIVHEVLRSPGQPLDANTRAFMEPRLGYDLGQVRVHVDQQAQESARSVNALAYTVGPNVVFGPGQYAPATDEGKKLLAHELTHTVQQAGQTALQSKLEIGGVDSAFEREADRVATSILNQPAVGSSVFGDRVTQQTRPGIISRAAIHSGNILDEGSCAHLACNSKWACQDDDNGITCPKGTRNASDKKKFRPLFTCDSKCANGKTCSDSDTWMAIPMSRFKSSKCGQDLVICANGHFTHGQVRDKSEKEAWEVSHGIQDALAVSPYAKFKGTIYADETDPDFTTDTKCRSKTAAAESNSVPPSAPGEPSSVESSEPTAQSGESETTNEEAP